jgi:hypothetical protein
MERTLAYARITKRPWSADPVLSDVMDSFVLSKASFMHVLTNSHSIRARFEYHQHKAPERVIRTVRSLCMAKQRFDSTQKPLGRLLLWLDAVVCTAVEVARDRKGQPEGDKASVFLDLLTEERLVVLAMLADAGDEAMALTRYLDCESFETELLTEEISRFLERIRWLFTNAGCLQTGYTACIIEYLAATRLVPSHDGRMRMPRP